MTLYDVLLEINNFFVRDYECLDVAITENTIEGEFANDYVVGQYIRLEGSTLNNGVYEITDIAEKKLILCNNLKTESNREVTIYGLAIPNNFISLANEIIASGSNENITSETVSRYSVSYGEGGKSWTSAFKKQLDRYRKMRW